MEKIFVKTNDLIHLCYTKLIPQISNYKIDGVVAIGDSRRDLEAAVAAGCSPMLVRTGNGRNTEAGLVKTSLRRAGGVPVFDDLAAAVSALITAETRL